MSGGFTNGYALLVGVDENHVQRWALPDVARDIEALAGVLTHPDRCAYARDNLKVITGQAATRQGILDGLDWLHGRIQADTSGDATAVVYYTGHGWRDVSAGSPQFFLVPYDVREDQVQSRGLRAVDLAEAVGGLRPRRLLVILDCCHASGMEVKDLSPLPASYAETAIAPSLLMAGEEAVAGPGAKGLESLASGQGRAVLSSSSGEQPSYLRRDRKMSIFTYHLIEALTGHAGPQAGASQVLVSDVMSHVTRRVPQSARADWGADQEPDFRVSGNFPVALLLGGKGLGTGQPAPDPLAAMPGEEKPPTVQRVDTGGGAHIGGSVRVGRDFIGRDQIKYGDQVGGDQIRAGDISGGSGFALGRGARADMAQGLSGQEIAQLFAAVYQAIQSRPEHPDVGKEELTATVQNIQAEVEKGEAANLNKVERWLRTLAHMADDIFEVTVACLTSPAAGVATVIHKVVERVRQEAGQA